VLVGPSGCGKSTALRLIAGLDQADGGSILIDGRDVGGVPPQDRDVAMVFQGYALYPHLSVRDNIAFPLKMRKVSSAERSRRVADTAEMLGLTRLLDRYPSELSGGERQRVAMGRAIVRSPKAFLFDEPLSNLDAALRAELRIEIASLVRRLGTTSLYVTHDQVEAMTMGDRIAVLRSGVLQQIGAPRAIYESPANVFVAGFLGSPPINLVELELDGGMLRNEHIAIATPAGFALPARVTMGIRPEHVHVEPSSGAAARAPQREPPAGAVIIEGTVAGCEPLGSETYVYVDTGPPAEAGDAAPSRLRAKVLGFDAPAREAAVRLAVDPTSVLWFDTESGRRIAPA
jgi:multiple sugar transport system ATP-binding protein